MGEAVAAEPVVVDEAGRVVVVDGRGVVVVEELVAAGTDGAGVVAGPAVVEGKAAVVGEGLQAARPSTIDTASRVSAVPPSHIVC